MLIRLLAALALWLAQLAGAGIAQAEVAVPNLTARVTDLTGTLTATQRGDLEQRLAALEQRKGSQIFVLMLPTTQPETIEQYAVRAFEQWKVGRKGVDDGILLVIAKDDRKLRIEVGYGLEGAVPDAAAKRIIAEDITPHFRSGDFYGGIGAGVDRLIRTVDGEPLPTPEQHKERSRDLEEPIIFGLALFFIFGGILRSIFGRFFGSALLGGGAGVLAWFLGSLLIAIPVSLVVFIASLIFGAAPMARAARGGWHSGGFGGGGFGGGGFGGGGFGGGGFGGGGGGGSGGGGASGSW